MRAIAVVLLFVAAIACSSEARTSPVPSLQAESTTVMVIGAVAIRHASASPLPFTLDSGSLRRTVMLSEAGFANLRARLAGRVRVGATSNELCTAGGGALCVQMHVTSYSVVSGVAHVRTRVAGVRQCSETWEETVLVRVEGGRTKVIGVIDQDIGSFSEQCRSKPE